MKSRDKYKTGYFTHHGQYIYLEISQSLISALHIYSQFSDIIFKYLPKIDMILAQLFLI